MTIAERTAIKTTTAEPTFAEDWLAERAPTWPSLRRGRGLEMFHLRDSFIERFGFGVLTSRVVQEIVAAVGPEARILEVGAGNGYWSFELENAGLDVLATDPGGWDEWWTELRPNEYGVVERLDGVEAVRRHDDRNTLLMVWPEMEEWPTETLEAFTGHQLVLCGETPGVGCTGNQSLAHLLERDWELHEAVSVPNFPMISDYVSVWTRQP